MSEEKGIIHVLIAKELEEKFREEVTRLYGRRNSALRRAIEEAIVLWLIKKDLI